MAPTCAESSESVSSVAGSIVKELVDLREEGILGRPGNVFHETHLPHRQQWSQSSGINVNPRRARPGLAGLRLHIPRRVVNSLTNHFTAMCSGSKAGSYVRLVDLIVEELVDLGEECVLRRPGRDQVFQVLHVLQRALRFRAQGSGSRVQGSEFRVQGSGFRVQGSGFAPGGIRSFRFSTSFSGPCQ